MTEQENQLLNNLAALCKSSRLTADEHDYFKNGLQYLANKLTPAADAPSEASAEQPAAPALAAVPTPSEA